MKVSDIFVVTERETLVHLCSLEKEILWEGAIKNVPLVFINKQVVQLNPTSKDTLSLILDISTTMFRGI